MPYFPVIQQDQYPATDETQCLEIIIPAGDEFKALLAGLMVSAADVNNYADPLSPAADGLAAIWDQAYSEIDWGGCAPVPTSEGQGRVTLWHRWSIVATGNALQTTMDASQPFNYFCRQNVAANNDAFYQLAWLSAGSYSIDVLGVRITDQAKLTVSLEYVDTASFTYAISNAEFYGSTLYNYVVSGTFTLTDSGLYKIYGQATGKNAASSGYNLRLTSMEIVRTS